MKCENCGEDKYSTAIFRGGTLGWSKGHTLILCEACVNLIEDRSEKNIYSKR